jgi:hypothetical protein
MAQNLKFVFNHRYLISRLNLQVFYLWRHVLAAAPPFILWWSNLEILFVPLHRSSPFIGGLRCQAIQTEHGSYIAERTKKSVYFVKCLWQIYTEHRNRYQPRGRFPSLAWSYSAWKGEGGHGLDFRWSMHKYYLIYGCLPHTGMAW